jgi:sulfite dehydrogenase (cytochrome) subunit B
MTKTNARKRLSAGFVFMISGALCMPPIVRAEPRAYELPPETIRLLPGPGVEAAAPCTGCHSPDYIKTQPPGQGKTFWTAIVNKMRKVFGAPVEEEDVAKIVDYLAATY